MGAKTVVIEGVVASVPESSELGLHCRFYVEKILTEGAIVPKNISLDQHLTNLYDDSKSTEEVTPEFNLFNADEL